MYAYYSSLVNAILTCNVLQRWDPVSLVCTADCLNQQHFIMNPMDESIWNYDDTLYIGLYKSKTMFYIPST